jgi:MFS superfamily sulfate permease-like transporter
MKRVTLVVILCLGLLLVACALDESTPVPSEFIILTTALAITAGLISIVAGILHLGRIAQFFSASVLIGFVSGLAWMPFSAIDPRLR